MLGVYLYNYIEGMKNNKLIFKYSKITPQKKFHLLTLVHSDKMLIKDAAKLVGINYSTAKTIVFFNRNGDKTYQFELHKPQQSDSDSLRGQANYLDICDDQKDDLTKKEPIAPIVDIISTVGQRNQTYQANKIILSVKTPSISLRHSLSMAGKDEDDLFFHKGEAKYPAGQSQVMEQRPLTRSQAARLRCRTEVKIEQQEQSQHNLTLKQQEQEI